MKQCPTCFQNYDDTEMFCQNDGIALVSFDSSEETVIVQTPNFNRQTLPTQLNQTNSAPIKQISPILYALIGGMAVLILVLGGFLLYPRSSSDTEKDKAETIKKSEDTTKDSNKNEKVTTTESEPIPSPTVKIIVVEKEVPKIVSVPATPPSSSYGYGRFPEGSTRFLTNSDLSGKSNWDLRIMRNEIFARHGYIFKKPELIQYFSGQSWYVPRYNDVSSLLSNSERQNARFLKNHE